MKELMVLMNSLNIILICLPIVATLLFYRIFYWLFKHKVKALHQSINWSTITFIVAIDLLLLMILEQQYIGYIFILLLSILMIIIIVQWKRETDIQMKKAIKLMWRISFLIFFISYVILFGYWIILEMTT